MKTLEDKLKAGEENANKLKEGLALEKKLSSDKNSQVNAGAIFTGARIRIRFFFRSVPEPIINLKT